MDLAGRSKHGVEGGSSEYYAISFETKPGVLGGGRKGVGDGRS